jgi:hypothetical protein
MGNFLEVKMTKKRTKVFSDYETSIYEGCLYFEDCKQAGVDEETFTEIIDHSSVQVIRVFSLSSTWLENVWVDGIGFQKEMIDIEMTIRKETRSGKSYWYAYRRVLGKLHKRFLGSSENVTQTSLLKVARAMPTTKIAVVK